MAVKGKTNNPNGRPLGSVNKRSLAVMELLEGLEVNPIVGMALIASERIVCKVCRGTKKAKYFFDMEGRAHLRPDDGTEKTCLTCLGSGFHPVPIELQGTMFKELAQYVAPKLRAVEHTNPDGNMGSKQMCAVIYMSNDPPKELEGL